MQQSANLANFSRLILQFLRVFMDITGWTAEPVNAFDLFVALGLVKCFTSSICRSANQSNSSFKHKLLAVFASSFKL